MYYSNLYIVQIFLSQGLCMGLAMGLTYSPSLVINGYYFQTRKRALAMGIATCGSAVGGVVQPIMLNNLLANGTSFANTVRINAAMNTGLLVVACLVMSDPRSRQSVVTKKASVNLRAFFKDMNYVLLVVGYAHTLVAKTLGLHASFTEDSASALACFSHVRRQLL